MTFLEPFVNHQEYNDDWNNLNFYQLNQDQRRKFQRYSKQVLDSFFVNEQHFENFKKEILDIKVCAFDSMTKIIETSMHSETSNLTIFYDTYQ
jgi:hypothetical protein